MKIEIIIYGNKNSILSGINYCSCGNSSCFKCPISSSCKSARDGNSAGKLISRKTCDLYRNLKNFLEISDVAQNIELKNFVFSTEEELRVKSTIEKGFSPPITVIDGIIRYYGGISNILIYRDVKELLS